MPLQAFIAPTPAYEYFARSKVLTTGGNAMKHSIISVRERSRVGFWRVKSLLSMGFLSVGLLLGANVAFAQNNANSQTVNLPMKYTAYRQRCGT